MAQTNVTATLRWMCQWALRVMINLLLGAVTGVIAAVLVGEGARFGWWGLALGLAAATACIFAGGALARRFLSRLPRPSGRYDASRPLDS